MPYVVTRACCSDASCVVACPVNCIHPAPGEPGFAEAEMVYVDPRACVDCGACATACPVDAIKPHSLLTLAEQPFADLNAAYFQEHPHADRSVLAQVPKPRRLSGRVRVAVVGSGPAGLYVADELLKHAGVTVDVFERLATPYGLVATGVAPDHPETRRVTSLFGAIERQAGFRYILSVEVGSDVAHDDLVADYDAVVYAVGASADKSLGIEGEDLPGCTSARELVAWYNGHPEHLDLPVPLDSERAVVVGNGNVALDVARILTRDPEDLAGTDISRGALEVLRRSSVREVVVLGRRSAAHAAFTLPELVGLAAVPGIDVVVQGDLDEADPRGRLLATLHGRPRDTERRRIVFRFGTAPVRVLGDEHAVGVETSHGDVIEAGAVLRAVGYRGEPVPGLPFDEQRCVVPNVGGRVSDGVYVAGWIKRGPSGFIGTNKACAEETVRHLLDDVEARRGALVS